MAREQQGDLRVASVSGRLLVTSVYAVAFTLTVLASEAYAVPSFARQTGMSCTSCHTAFPQLTPFGRAFKLSGYTMSNEQSHLPPLAMMLQGSPGFTHTEKAQPAGAVPSGFNSNDNVSLNQLSFFYAGRLFGPYADLLAGKSLASILNSIGIFAQGTWDGVAKHWTWDNMEVRAAKGFTVAETDVILGAYVNNNPTLQDLWNTASAWQFPFSGSSLAPTPAAAPLIAGGLAQQVIGFGGYGMFNHVMYLEAGAYKTLAAHVQKSLGVDPTGQTQVPDFAPYWRVAFEKNWSAHSLEIGTVGLSARTFPGRNRSAGHDRFTDVGVDLQYQYLSARHDVTLLTNWIHEAQRLRASRPLGIARNSSNSLWTAALASSYLFDKTYGVTLQYFRIGGDKDLTLYGSRTGRPDTDRWIVQLDYLPFNKLGGPSFWSSSGLKLSLQYTLYSRFNGAHRNFDGAGRNASDNNTLYRIIGLQTREQFEALQAARKRQTTTEFAHQYAARSGIEATHEQALRRCGLRHSRYIGLAKTHLQHLITATAINLVRLSDWFAGLTPAPTRHSRFSSLQYA